MNTVNYRWSVVEKDENLTVFSLVDSTGKLVMDLVSDSSPFLDRTSYTIDTNPVLLDWSLTEYDVDSFSAIIKEYIVYLQKNEHQDSPFRLIIQRKSKVDDSFYEKAWQGLKDYADKITIKSGNNMMILNCD